MLARPRMRFLSRKAFPIGAISLLAAGFSAGCEESDTTETGGGGSGGGGTTTSTTGTTSTTSSAAPGITALAAPDRVSVRIEVSGVEQVPADPSAYSFSSELGALEVTAVSWDPAAKVILLQTGKQKLGVEYEMSIYAPGDALDGLGGKVLAADTATFWATDFGTFEPYEVTAERVGVGEHVVLYLEPGLSAADIDETIAQFDAQIFPIETELLHAAPDRDENGRVVLLGLDGEQYYGGYFFPFDALTDEEVSKWGYHSNEMEMLYVNVAAIGGYAPDVVVAHEFGHLLYQEQHPFQDEDEYFQYHNEGLAECATHAVYGTNQYASSYYVADPDGQLAKGKSLVHWDDGNYTQYAQAYVFWTYIASQTGGVSGYRDLFLSNGSPAAIEALLLRKLGLTFAETQIRALAAAWVQAASGPYGFEGMLALPGSPQVVPAGTTSLQLAPFAAAFFPQSSDGVTATGAGPNLRFLGLDASKQPDADAPFDVAGGVVIALNGRLDWKDKSAEPSGVLGADMGGAKIVPPPGGGRDLSWLHPPPVPSGMGALEAWRQRTSGF